MAVDAGPFVLKLLGSGAPCAMPACSTCGRIFFVDPSGCCRGCIALRRLAGELRFVPLGELDASLTVYLLETCLHTVEYLRDVAHAQAERAEQARQGRTAPGLGLSSNNRSGTEGTSASTHTAAGGEHERHRGDRERPAEERPRKKEERGDDGRERKRRRRG